MPRTDNFRTERHFGLLVGGVFAALGGFWLWRGHFPAAAKVLAPLGGVLFLLGALWPRSLVWPNRAWMTMAEGISWVMTRVVLGIVFFIAMTPIGLVNRLRGWDPLRRRAKPAPSYWVPYPDRQRDPRHYERMY